MNHPRDDRPVLLTGATGFVGSHLYPALDAAGVPVRCASRSPEKAARSHPGREWVEIDLEKPHTLDPALAGCRAAYYLIHRISNDPDYVQSEVAGARDFAAAAAKAGLERIVYMGGVEPAGKPSRHLEARLETGRVLRAGEVPTVELRAAMIIGAGSASWEMVHDLAKRLPAMVLPRWLQNRSRPVLIDDVVVALLAALDLPAGWNGWLDAPGPTTISHKELLRMVAREKGYSPLMVDVPVVTPKLSSYWIGLVSDTKLEMVQELVEGLTSDLLPSGELIWDRLPSHRPVEVDQAIRLALGDSRVRKKGADDETAADGAAERIRKATAAYLEGPRISGSP